MKFRKLVYEALISELDIKHMMRKMASKFRGVARIFGLFPIEKVLNKYPELASLYQSVVIGDKDMNDIEAEMKQILARNPAIMTEIKNQVRRNVMDLSTDYIEQSLKLMKEILDPSTSGDKLSKIEDLLTSGSEDELRKGLLDLANEEIAEIEAELKSDKPFAKDELKKYKSGIRYRPEFEDTINQDANLDDDEKIDWEDND